MSSVGTLLYIHGFLGRGQDWSPMRMTQWESLAPDFFSSNKQDFKDYSFPVLADQVNAMAQSISITPRVLVGYSWGGRVALHSLLRAQQLYAGAILIGTHPGLAQEEERSARLESDLSWSNRFLSEDWKSLIQAWNHQPVFQSTEKLHSFSQVRGESLEQMEREFSKQALALALKNCSLGKQEDLRPSLKQLQIPTLWIVGGEDLKFKALYQGLSQSQIPWSRFVEIPGAGHRVHLEQPSQVNREIQKFLVDIQLCGMRESNPYDQRMKRK